MDLGKVDFLESKYKEAQEDKTFNFYKYTTSAKEDKENAYNKKRSMHIEDNIDDDVDPIQTDVTDSTYFVNSEDGMTFSFKPKQ